MSYAFKKGKNKEDACMRWKSGGKADVTGGRGGPLRERDQKRASPILPNGMRLWQIFIVFARVSGPEKDPRPCYSSVL